MYACTIIIIQYDGSRKKSYSMNKFHIFIIRCILGALFAVLLMRFFFPRASLPYSLGLGIFMVGFVYVTEFFRNKKSR